MFRRILNKINEINNSFKYSRRLWMDHFFSFIPGNTGWVLRRYGFRGRIKMGKNTAIDEHVCIKYPERLSMGSDSFIGRCTMIQASGGVEIGSDVIIGPYVKIWSSDHVFENLDQPIHKQGHQYSKVVIQDDVWIGTGVIVLKGIIIGKGSVCAAGSVVVNDIPDFSVVAGNPAKVIRSRLKQ